MQSEYQLMCNCWTHERNQVIQTPPSLHELFHGNYKHQVMWYLHSKLEITSQCLIKSNTTLSYKFWFDKNIIRKCSASNIANDVTNPFLHQNEKWTEISLAMSFCTIFWNNDQDIVNKGNSFPCLGAGQSCLHKWNVNPFCYQTEFV